MMLGEDVWLTGKLQTWSSVVIGGERYGLGSCQDAYRLIGCCIRRLWRWGCRWSRTFSILSRVALFAYPAI